MKALIAIAMIWATLSGGAGSALDATAGGLPILTTVSQGMQRVLPGRSGGYTSHWDGQRISTQAMRQVW